MHRYWMVSLVIGMAFLVVGCQKPSMRGVAERAEKAKARTDKNRKILTPENSKHASRRTRSQAPSQTELDALQKSFEATHVTAMNANSGGTAAVRQATRAIDASLEVGPTLVVWLFDRTESAQPLVMETTQAAKAFYDSPEYRNVVAGGNQKLLTVVAAFDETLDVLAEPTDDAAKIQTAFDSALKGTKTPEKTFTALKQLFEKYSNYRTEQMREVMFVVVTDEAGSDQNEAEAVTESFRRLLIPVYVIGVPAPWGQTNPFAKMQGAAGNPNDEQYPTYGPESRQSERVDIVSWSHGYNYGSAENLSLVDSGFGPFALERLCRESSGMFLAVRADQYSPRRFGVAVWPSGSEVGFDRQVVKRYAPDYVSKEDYDKLLAANKARKAVVEAAKLEPVRIDGTPTTSFTKRDEAQMSRQLSTAQQFAARNAPKVDRMFEALQAGEGDRERLTDPRWQAEYDLAMGQATALKVRVDGYNAMIAALKRGKTFQNEASREWILESGETIETGSALQKMADKARMYLQRVVKEHPGTPWAKIAEEELKNPLGWQWREA